MTRTAAWWWCRCVNARSAGRGCPPVREGGPAHIRAAAAGAPAAVAVALVLDRVWREPPLAVHPVRLIGIGLDTAGRRIPAGPPVRAAVTGGVAWTVGAVAGAAAGVGVPRAGGGGSPGDRAVAGGPAVLAAR